MRYWYYSLKRGILNFFRNIWIQRKALWGSYWCDYNGLLLYMQTQLKHMEYKQRKDGQHLYTDKYCDQMKVCIILLERLIEDDYDIERWNFTEDRKAFCGLRMTPKYSFPTGDRRVNLLGMKQRKTDKEYLFKVVNKYLDHWWS